MDFWVVIAMEWRHDDRWSHCNSACFLSHIDVFRCWVDGLWNLPLVEGGVGAGVQSELSIGHGSLGCFGSMLSVKGRSAFGVEWEEVVGSFI